MSRIGNPLGNGSIAQSRAMYADLGLCYECGRQLENCTCEKEEAVRSQLECADELEDEHPGQAVTAREAADRIDPRTAKEKALDEFQAEVRETHTSTIEWFQAIPEIEF